jgi:Rrf2 family protein
VGEHAERRTKPGMNTQFGAAVHILLTLVLYEDSVPSDHLGWSLSTKGSWIRRVLTKLHKAGLTRSQRGASGGVSLARPAESITLLDVRRALGEEGIIVPRPTNPRAPIGGHIARVLGKHISAAEEAFEKELARITIDQLARELASVRPLARATALHRLGR